MGLKTYAKRYKNPNYTLTALVTYLDHTKPNFVCTFQPYLEELKSVTNPDAVFIGWISNS